MFISAWFFNFWMYFYWMNKITELATYSESQWQEALYWLRAQNRYGYYVRLNTPVEYGVGKLGKS